MEESIRLWVKILQKKGPDSFLGDRPSQWEDPNEGPRKKQIQIGPNHQAVIPEFIPPSERNVEELKHRALQIWKPNDALNDNEIDAFVLQAKGMTYTPEQALGLLNFNLSLEQARADLPQFCYDNPDEWEELDKQIVERAFKYHGKEFLKIQKMLPEKPLGSIIQFYYNWKWSMKNKKALAKRQAGMDADGDQDMEGLPRAPEKKKAPEKKRAPRTPVPKKKSSKKKKKKW